MAVLVENDVLWFEISEDNISRMEILNREEDLSEILSSFLFTEEVFFFQVLRQIPSLTKLKYEEQPVICLERKVDPTDERVVRYC